MEISNGHHTMDINIWYPSGCSSFLLDKEDTLKWKVLEPLTKAPDSANSHLPSVTAPSSALLKCARCLFRVRSEIRGPI